MARETQNVDARALAIWHSQMVSMKKPQTLNLKPNTKPSPCLKTLVLRKSPSLISGRQEGMKERSQRPCTDMDKEEERHHFELLLHVPV